MVQTGGELEQLAGVELGGLRRSLESESGPRVAAPSGVRVRPIENRERMRARGVLARVRSGG